jgi:hypothetical protein
MSYKLLFRKGFVIFHLGEFSVHCLATQVLIMCCPSFNSWVSCWDVQAVTSELSLSSPGMNHVKQANKLKSFPYALNNGPLSSITLKLIVSPLSQILYTTPSYPSLKTLNHHAEAKSTIFSQSSDRYFQIVSWFLGTS